MRSLGARRRGPGVAEDTTLDIAKVDAVFRSFDRNGDRTIDRNELDGVLQRLNPGLSREDLQQLFQEVDINNDGQIDYREFLVWLRSTDSDWERLKMKIRYHEGSESPDAGRPKPDRDSRWLEAIPPHTATDIASSHYKRCTRSPAPLPEVAQSLLEDMTEVSDGDQEAGFIKTYTHNQLFALVNLALREDDPVALESYGGYIFALKDAIRHKGKAHGWYGGQAFRGMQLPDDILDWYRSLSCDDKFLWAGFVSASKVASACFEGNILFEIDCNGPGVTYVLDIEEWSVYPEEKEVLFFPYSGFCVKGSREEEGQLRVFLQSYDRVLIDESDMKEKLAKKKALRSARKSFVLHIGMEVVCGNKKHTHTPCTALRHRPDDAHGSNFNGVGVRNGASAVIRELHDRNAWALIEAEAGSGWIKTRNLHVQLGVVTSASEVGDGFFVLGVGRRARAGNTRHDCGVTALRHNPSQEKGENFNGVTVRDGELVEIISGTTRDGEWVKVLMENGGEGWLKTRNVHVQLV